MSLKYRSGLMLLLAAFIWGTAFVAQSVGMDFVGPHTFGGIRFTLGGIVLLPVIALRTRRGADSTAAHIARLGSPAKAWRATIIAGVCCGIALFCASTMQQMAMITVDSGKAGFVTSLYIVLVPVLGLLIGRKLTPMIAISVLMAAAGLYLLCMSGGFALETTDLLLLGSALFFAIQILAVDHFVTSVDPVRLSCAQFFVDGVLGIICMFLFEQPSLEAIWACLGPILYAGVLSSGVAFTLQVVGQQHTPPAAASLLMSFESVFSVLAGAVMLGETLTTREGMGCVVMFAAILISQLGDVVIEKFRSRRAAA